MKTDQMSTAEKILGLIAIFVVLGCFIATGLSLNFVARSDLAKAERADCRRGISDRLGTIRVRDIRAKGARAIANDPSQSAKTRKAQRKEADELETSIFDLQMRVDPEHGGTLVCDKTFPNPRIF